MIIDDLVAATPGLNKPLFIFVDELDRCRPTYAVKLLESIKHLFSTRDTIFVLAIDKKQISHSIRTLYGIGMDSNAYLARFIDQSYKLPLPSYAAFTKMLFQKMPFQDVSFDEHSPNIQSESDFLKVLGEFAACFRLSLREYEQGFARVRAALLTSKTKPHLLFLSFLTFANIKFPEKFDLLNEKKLRNL